MKKLFFIAFLMVTLVRLAPAQPVGSYTNTGTVTTPILIDATNFINLGTFELSSGSTSPYGFLDVMNYTNRGVMAVFDTGLLFDRSVQDQFGALTHFAANLFGNAGQGQIYAGEPGQTPVTFFTEFGLLGFQPPLIEIFATNIINRGLIDTDVSGVIVISGRTVDLSRSTIHVEGFDPIAGTDLLATTAIPNIGINAQIHGLGKQTNLLSVASFTVPGATSPASVAATGTGLATSLIVTPPSGTAFPLEFMINASNMAHQVVIINTNLFGVTTSVRFDTSGGELATPTIEWQAAVTNIAGQAITNFLYLQDVFGSSPTNFNLVTNSFTFSGFPQLAPYNYTFTQTFPGFTNLTPADAGYNPATIFAAAFKATNEYSVLEVNVQPESFAPDPTALASSLTNLPGRIELTAEGDGSTLDLNRAIITGANYLVLNAPNHFAGSSLAQIVAPNMDINLGSTNGTLTVSNLVAPSIPRFSGLIDMYSARWTRVDTNNFTNTYCVLFVSSSLSPSSPVQVQNLRLRGTSVVLNDLLTVNSNLLINAQNLTLGTNDPTSQVPFGILDILNPDISWPESLPVLQNFTNFGEVEVSFLSTFLNFNDLSGAPYNSFVNHNFILASGLSVLATNFENSGFSALMEASGGPIFITATNALLSGGELFSPSDISLSVGNLSASNSFIQATGSLSVSVSNTLADGGAFSGNFWTAGQGMNLLQRPASGDFLGTTVTLTAPAAQEVGITWAGLDRGRSASGFTNNGAVGHLILSGGNANSDFAFAGLEDTTNYAIYVDQIDLQNGATNRTTQNGAQIFTAFNVATNMTVYFADAIIGSTDISEKLNGANGGRLIWVPAYAGILSGITVKADNAGHTVLANRALAQSEDIDSNGNGIFNAFDDIPFFTGFTLNLGVSITNLPPQTPVITWSTVPGSTNILYAFTNLASTNPVVVTNFVATTGNPSFNAVTRTARVVDQGRTNAAVFYKVQVNLVQP